MTWPPSRQPDDAAQVHRFTGVAPSRAVHIPWDRVDDYTALARYAAELRQEAGLEPDPVAAYQRSGYAAKIVAERTGGAPTGWGA